MIGRPSTDDLSRSRVDTTKSALSPARRRLLETMQLVGFGRIENLSIRQGEPCFNPAPKIIQEIKIGGENGPRPELTLSDFALKTQVTELFAHLNCVADGTVAAIEVKHGLPFRLVVEQQVSPEEA